MKKEWSHLGVTILCWIYIFLSTSSYGQKDTSYPDTSIKYKPDAGLQLTTQIVETTNSYQIFLRITLSDSVDIDDLYRIKYETTSSFDQEKVILFDSLTYKQHGIHMTNDSYILRFDISKGEENNILKISVDRLDDLTVYQSTQLLNHDIIFPYPDYYLSEHQEVSPLFRTYISELDTLIIRDLLDDNSTYYIYYYAKDFEIADPPMYLLDKNVSRSLNIDSVFTLKSGQAFSCSREGFYFVQKDTSGYIGIPFRVQDRHFPRLASIDDLYEPVIYLSTGGESQKLVTSEERKRAFDEFWIGMTKSASTAKTIIRDYYQQVEEANQLFTGYKEGWKTDMGMIYIILGPPDNIFNNGFSEEWYYNNRGQLPGINFSFARIKNLFSRNHYVLLRKEQYKNYWFQAIDAWRKGLK